MNTLKGINTRRIGIFALAALGVAAAAPVQAAHGFTDGAFMVAKRDRSEEVRQDQQRDDRRDDRRDARRESEREERGYGYGYERRQQQQQSEEDDRTRGRRR